YVKSCLAALRAGTVHALAHITGGGLIENVPRVLPEQLTAEFDAGSWSLPPVFVWLARAGGLPALEMARTFNCGLGMVVIVPPAKADEAVRLFEAAGETVSRVGHIRARRNDEQQSLLLNAERWDLPA
ncbi:MAG: AIR synthase-related protein, partial [Rhodospirillaceae bacterium]|nr:AIR synthase-related protein [Rhodospirillaceae bacterium]